MKEIVIQLLAFTGGVFLAIQAGYNTQLSGVAKHPIVAVVATSLTSSILGFLLLVFFSNNVIQLSIFKSVPWYLWCVGGLFSMTGILIYFYTIPKLGISNMITLGLCGQVVFTVISGKFGWFDTPIEPFTIKRLTGIILMLISIILINKT